MIKLLLAILVTLLLIGYGIYSYGSGKSADKSGSNTTQVENPADAIDRARNAVEQSQNVKDQLNSKVKEQLDN